MEINCPSGLKGRVRKLKGSEANILADRRSAQKGETYDQILRAVWEETLDAGPYGFLTPGTDPVPWGKILVADRFCALVGARVATYGPDFNFPARCGETGKGCGHRFEWSINLETQLPLYDLPEESRAKIAANANRFETAIGDRVVVFRLQTGEDEKRAGKRITANRSEMMTTALATRILEIQGVEKSKVDQFLKDLDLDLQLDLLSRFEEVDGGFETQIEIECPQCGNVMDVTLPFEGEAFWLPRSRSKATTEGGRRKGRPARTLGKTGKTPEE